MLIQLMGRGTMQAWEQRHSSTGDHFFEQNGLRSDLGQLENVGEEGTLNGSCGRP